ncbi:DNA-directed primase/polymerase protein-like isoform X2 [Patiria miniata]|uniref:DNA-directed primase/polymerase protein n=1 Tax=Patiria miniata TaxID=46514 RepID=A0A914AEV6_PATMI|nr:DNA-directed primase/polymerase protein-like isoform X2 [Patiria miniata]
MALIDQKKRKEKQWEERLKKLQAVEAWYQTYPIIPAYRPCLIDPSPFWHTVYRQKHAFDVAAAHPEDVHVFAFEADNIKPDTASKGQRKYVITTYLQLWHTIYHLAAHGKYPTFYEVIPEGSACKLYFDLEFSRSLNPECNGAAMVQTLIKFVCAELMDVYQKQCGVHHVINLDATTDNKFSRHLIFNLPQTVFKDNVQAGNFVQHVCQKITRISQTTESDGEPEAKRQKHEDKTEGNRVPDSQRQHEVSLYQNLFVQNKDGQSSLFVDQGVYTRNRNFRLYKCIKFGKANPLLIAEDNKYKPRITSKSGTSQAARDSAMERHFFLDSLITNVSYCPGTHVLTMERNEGSTPKGSRPSNNKTTLAQDPSDLLEGFNHSPYPDLDAFIYTVITNGGIQGEIRRWVYFTQGQLLVYDIIKNRWCGNIQRQHKSNNIMILVDLRRGVYYQKCHDQDCKSAGYKSPDTPLPTELLPTLGDDLDDDELLAAVTAVEGRESAPHDMTGLDNTVTELSDEELLAATLQVEGNMSSRTDQCDDNNERVVTSSDGIGNDRGNCGDVTESDEELLAAMADAEHSDM